MRSSAASAGPIAFRGKYKAMQVVERVRVSPPEPYEVGMSMSLLSYIESVAPLETADMQRKRELIVITLTELVRDFIAQIAVARGMAPDIETARECGGAVLCSGSYRLGIIPASGGDMDLCAVVPNFVERADFFSLFVDMLRA